MPLVLAAVVACVAVATLTLSGLARGRRRIIARRFGVYAAIPSTTAVLVLLPLALHLSVSDGLSLAGLTLSLCFGIGAPVIERMTLRLKIGIVIPSRMPFHSELRAGFRDRLAQRATVRPEIDDPYVSTHFALENLSEFLPALRSTIDAKPDYLVICSPAVALVSSEQVARLLTTFIRKGGGVVFIDNEPTQVVQERLRKRWGYITSDVVTGADILVGYVGRHLKDGENVVVLCGPSSSAPSVLRREAFAKLLPKAAIKVADTGGWTEESAYAETKAMLREGQRPRFIVCGNDVMALGAVRALQDWPGRPSARNGESEVIGYDGIARALFAIAEPVIPFGATIRTPPSAYGQEIAAMILDDSAVFRWGCRLTRCQIPVTDGQLITRFNVKNVLDG